MRPFHFIARLGLGAGVLCIAGACSDSPTDPPADPPFFKPMPVVTWSQLHDALGQAQTPAPGSTRNVGGGLQFNMWATVLDRNGVVVAVAFTGATEGDQWPGSRVISAQKANTANAFSLPKFALSTANLYAATQPGGSLFGLQEANPTDPDVAFGGKTEDYGTPMDFMVGHRIGGTNVFGGGLALYDASGTLLGGLGVSGDASCADHNIAWKLRFLLQLDHVPAGVADGGADDNIIYDITNGVSTSGFGHAACSAEMTDSSNALPTRYPIGH